MKRITPRRASSLLCAALLSSAFMSGCVQTPSTRAAEPCTETIFAMNTVMVISAYGSEEAVNGAADIIYSLERELSVTDDRSEIYNINATGSGEVSENTSALLKRALELCEDTDGTLDITIYPVVKAWGFTTGEYQVPSDSTISSLLENVNYESVRFEENTVTVPQGAEIDLGAVTKGYTGDKVIEYWKGQGITSGLLNLGGNVQALGVKPDGTPWKVGIRDPLNTESYIGALSIDGKCVITSGGYERFFEEAGVTYCHIIDPSTGRPAENGIISATVIGDEGTMCDALSTSIYIMGLEKGTDYYRSHNGFDMILVTDDGSLYITEGIKDSFTPMNDYKDREVNIIYR